MPQNRSNSALSGRQSHFNTEIYSYYFRDQIDTASFEYNEARRRFDLAEKEYIASKFDLQTKTEAKVKYLFDWA